MSEMNQIMVLTQVYFFYNKINCELNLNAVPILYFCNLFEKILVSLNKNINSFNK